MRARILYNSYLYAMKIWQKNTEAHQLVDQFTVGNDRELDLMLAKADVLGSLAHTRMLHAVGLLDEPAHRVIQQGLKQIYQEIVNGGFRIDDGVEDVHSQVEILLTERIGEAGKKIHSGRSRNDQVLVDLKLFFRMEIEKTVRHIQTLFERLIALSETRKDVLMPGYTHLQIAMPSSFG